MYTLVVRVAGGGDDRGDVQTLTDRVSGGAGRGMANPVERATDSPARHLPPRGTPSCRECGDRSACLFRPPALETGGRQLVRLAHYPHDPHVLDLADRLGILVFAELPTIWLGEEQMADPDVLMRAVATFDALWRRDRHHPSIILWGLLSECATQTEAGERFFARLAAEVRQRDPSRLIIQASETPDGDRCFQYADVLGLNYFHGWYADAPIGEYGEALDRLHAHFPDKPILLSSHGADAIAGFRSFHDAKWSEEAQAAYHAAVIGEVRRRPFVVGQSIWLLADYQGPAWRTARFTPLQARRSRTTRVSWTSIGVRNWPTIRFRRSIETGRTSEQHANHKRRPHQAQVTISDIVCRADVQPRTPRPSSRALPSNATRCSAQRGRRGRCTAGSRLGQIVIVIEGVDGTDCAAAHPLAANRRIRLLLPSVAARMV